MALCAPAGLCLLLHSSLQHRSRGWGCSSALLCSEPLPTQPSCPSTHRDTGVPPALPAQVAPLSLLVTNDSQSRNLLLHPKLQPEERSVAFPRALSVTPAHFHGQECL